MTEAIEKRLTDPLGVPDLFVSGLGAVEDMGGGNYRFVFYCKQHPGRSDEELVVVAKLIAPMEAVPPALFAAARAVGMSLAMEMPRRSGISSNNSEQRRRAN